MREKPTKRHSSFWLHHFLGWDDDPHSFHGSSVVNKGVWVAHLIGFVPIHVQSWLSRKSKVIKMVLYTVIAVQTCCAACALLMQIFITPITAKSLFASLYGLRLLQPRHPSEFTGKLLSIHLCRKYSTHTSTRTTTCVGAPSPSQRSVRLALRTHSSFNNGAAESGTFPWRESSGHSCFGFSVEICQARCHPCSIFSCSTKKMMQNTSSSNIFLYTPVWANISSDIEFDKSAFISLDLGAQTVDPPRVASLRGKRSMSRCHPLCYRPWLPQQIAPPHQI